MGSTRNSASTSRYCEFYFIDVGYRWRRLSRARNMSLVFYLWGRKEKQKRGRGRRREREREDRVRQWGFGLTDGGSNRDNVNGLPPLPFTPSYDFETFSTTFEDPFSYSAPRPDEAAPDPASFNEESSPQELDNKLLGFSAPILKATVIDETGQFSELGMSAELFGMFFVAEDVYNAENTGRPLELTCYRRNLWQCSGQITLPRHMQHLVDEQGRQLPIAELAASITAIESIEGKPTEIISIPWKSSNPSVTGGGEEAKVAGAPPHIPIDLSGGQKQNKNHDSIPVSWKRLQIKHATANTGRRKGLQQHYVVQIQLLAKVNSGELVKMAEIQSGPVIVRGRSPRNFDSRKDVPLTGDKKFERRAMSSDAASAAAQKPSDRTDLAQNMQRYHSLGNIQVNFLTSMPSPSRPYSAIPLLYPPPPSFSVLTTPETLVIP